MKKIYYCGPYYAPKWLIKSLSYIFNPACKFHDEEYDKKNHPRLLIEIMFLLNMMEILFSFFIIIVKNILKLAIGCVLCPTFFVLVVLFGWISFNKIVKIDNIDDVD